MAKKKNDILLIPKPDIKSSAINEAFASKEDKKVKENGRSFWLTKDPEVKEIRSYMIPERTQFKECNDGWFQMFVYGDKAPFRLSQQRIENLKEFLK